MKRARGLDEKPIGCSHNNTLFDTREYEVEFNDGLLERYQANIIAENMFAQIDGEGWQSLVMKLYPRARSCARQ